MSKINQIENKLKEMNGEAFQKLADAYLHKKGYEHINSIGSAVGTDKARTGTPDSLITLPNGKYVFAEYTTQQTGVFKKIKEDLEKCFDEEKTGITLQKIAEVVFCHTSTLSPAQEDALRKECQKHGVNLNIFGIRPLSFDLYQKYPGLARDFLNVEVDTGQIVSPEDFVKLYNRSPLASPLDTAFHFREDEVDSVLEGLASSNLVIVNGRPGVGKTRIVLECLHRYSENHPEYQILCIFNLGPDLFVDLRVYLAEPKQYIIFVDDANRVNGFTYILQHLHNQDQSRKVKVIATVRDYALEKIKEISRSFAGMLQIDIPPLEDEKIKEMVRNEFQILNSRFLERIADISKGNPRLAVMAARVAVRENSLRSLSDVSTLYDEYYRSIRKDLEEFNNVELMKAAGIVAFFRGVDRTNEEMMREVEEAFSMDTYTFWEATKRLHDLEVFDLYEDEAVKVSDQVLATYLFYLVFIKEEILDFSILLRHFFPKSRNRLSDSIIPVLNAFDAETVKSKLLPHVDKHWKYLNKESTDNKSLLYLMESFWYIKETATLLFIRDQITNTKQETIEVSRLNTKPDSKIPSPSIMRTLSKFQYSSENNFLIALTLLFEYLKKKNECFAQMLYLLTDEFGYRHDSYVRNFSIQNIAIDLLVKHTKDGEDELFSKLFLAVAVSFLQTRFNTTETAGTKQFTMYKFELPVDPVILEQRKKIWSQIFRLYQKSEYRQSVLQLLQDYSASPQVTVSELAEQDATMIVPFLQSQLSPHSYSHCCVAQNVFKLLDKQKIEYDQNLKCYFRNAAYDLSKLLQLQWYDIKDLKLGYSEFEEYKKNILNDHLSKLSSNSLLSNCLIIFDHLNNSRKMYVFQQGVILALLSFAERDPNQYEAILSRYLELGDPFELRSELLVQRLVQTSGHEKAYALLNEHTFPSKDFWVLIYYAVLPQEEITNDHLKGVYALYQRGESINLSYNLDFLLKFRTLDPSVIERVTLIILMRSQENPEILHAISSLMNPHSEVNKYLFDLFAGNGSLIERAYLALLNLETHLDFVGTTFSRILDTSPAFLAKYIDQIYKLDQHRFYSDHKIDLSIIWERDDHSILMSHALSTIFKHETERGYFGPNLLEHFFSVQVNDAEEKLIRLKQESFLRGIIEDHSENTELMEFLFTLISTFPEEKRCQFVELFLMHNQNFKDFKKLYLVPLSMSWSGSLVPVLQKKAEFLESLLPIVDSVELLEHKHYIERYIQQINIEIEKEKKSDFLED